jgi:hypothetical protein
MSLLAAPKPLSDARIFGMCQGALSAADIDRLGDMGIDVIVRGISCAWDANPDQARDRMKSVAPLAELARKRGITFCTMITSSALFPEICPPGKLEAWSARDAHGNLIPAGSWHQGCLNNPEFRTFIRDIGRAEVDGGADGIHYDESYSRWFWMRPIPCFCDGCCAELRAWLKSHFTAVQLHSQWGIDDIDSFDYRAYLAAHHLADAPWQSPLHDQWWLMQLHSTVRWEQWIVADNKSYAREKYGRDLIVNSNQSHLTTISAMMTADSRVYDFINVGCGLSVEYRDQGIYTQLPIEPGLASFVPTYRMARAHSSGKPVSLFLDIQEHPKELADLPPRQEGLYMQWLFAEAHLTGCHFAAHYRFSDYDGPYEPQLAACKYFRKHANWYEGSRSAGRIAVLFSYPSQIWDMYGTYWDRSPEFPALCNQYYGVCQSLQRANLQWETVFVPDGDIFPGSLKAADLRGYDIVIAPGIYAAADPELAALAQYVHDGGRLLVTGPFAQFDGLHHKRAAALPKGLFPGPRVAWLTDDFENCIGVSHAASEAALVEALTGKLAHQPEAIVGSPDARLRLYLRHPAKGRALLLDAVNADFVTRRGFHASPATPIYLRVLGFKPASARLFTMDEPDGHPVPFRVEGPIVTINLPEVECYALVVLEP